MPRLSLVPIVLAAALVAAPQGAQAQILRGLGRAVADKAAQAAAAAVPGRDSAATPTSATSGVQQSAPSSTRVEITTERVDRFIAGMRPLLAANDQRRAYDAANDRFRKYAACKKEIQRQPAPAVTGAAVAELERLAKISLDLSQRSVAAAQANDTAALVRLRDTTWALQDRQEVLVNPTIRTQCGAYTTHPREPNRAQLDAAGAEAVKASGMTATQLGRMRERIALYLLGSPRGNDLTASEGAAVDARRADLASIVAHFQDGSLFWKTWGDLHDNWSGK